MTAEKVFEPYCMPMQILSVLGLDTGPRQGQERRNECLCLECRDVDKKELQSFPHPRPRSADLKDGTASLPHASFMTIGDSDDCRENYHNFNNQSGTTRGLMGYFKSIKETP